MPFMPINTKYVINGRVMGGTMFRKVAKRTKPWLLPAEATAAENPALLPPQPPQPPEDEEWVLPPAKRSRLHAPSSISTAQEHTRAEKVTTDDTPDDIPTDPVTPAASVASAVASRAPRQHWTLEEDTKLTEAVKKHGKKWFAVAPMVPGRTDKQCRQRWVDTRQRWVDALDPTKGKKPNKTRENWTPAQDAKLADAVKKHGEHWSVVAALVPGRTDGQCRQRWVDTLNRAIGGNKKPRKPRCDWKPDEDTKLAEAVKRHGNHWVAVAAMVPGRTDKQCRKRWVDTLNRAIGGKEPKKTRDDWKSDEDAKLAEAVKRHGKHWVAVATLVPGRTDGQCRRRWNSTYLASNTVEEEHISGNEEALDSAAE
jgi:hypothetical protein